jgi:hypothetical protein
MIAANAVMQPAPESETVCRTGRASRSEIPQTGPPEKVRRALITINIIRPKNHCTFGPFVTPPPPPPPPPPMAVSTWLEALELGRYRAAFEEHGIDGMRLLQMDDGDHLQRVVGVRVPLGHRKLLHKAVRQLRGLDQRDLGGSIGHVVRSPGTAT